MFDFQKEVIINSNKLEDGVTPRFMALVGKVTAPDGTQYDSLVPKSRIFRVLRCMDYVKEGIVNSVIWKTTANYGSVASATFTPPTAKGIYRVLIGLSLDERYLSDYAMPWYRFSKPVLAEFTLTDSNLANAANIMAKAIKLAIPENYQFIRVTVVSGKVKVTCVDTYQTIVTAKLQEAAEPECPANLCATYTDYGVQPNTADGTLVKNVMQTGTGSWLQENLRFPSYANLHYKALNSEEYPIPSALYDQYSFQYCSPRRGLHGQGTVGQQLVSVTTHTFYVLRELSAEFEQEIKNAFGDIISPVNTLKYNVTILGDSVINPAMFAVGDSSKVVLQATVDDSTLTTDATDFTWTLEGGNGKYTITKQTGGSAKVSLTTGSTAAEGDEYSVRVEYKGSYAGQVYTVSNVVSYVNAVAATWEDSNLKITYTLNPASTAQPIKKLINITGTGVTIQKSAADAATGITYIDANTIEQTFNANLTSYGLILPLSDLGLSAKTKVTVTVNPEGTTAESTNNA